MDISSTGMALKVDNISGMRTGQEAVVEIMSVSQKKIMRCSVKLSRIDRDAGVVGFEFINLNAFQEASLDKLVLEVQKREIQRQKFMLAESEQNQDAEHPGEALHSSRPLQPGDRLEIQMPPKRGAK